MNNILKWERKEESKTTPAHEPTSFSSPMLNLINNPNQNRHKLMLSTSPSAPPKQDVADVTMPSSSLSGIMPFSSILADTSAPEHVALNKSEQSRISKTVTIGQEDVFKEVCDFLRGTEVGMVGIYGMGGVGKTTLMKKVCNEFLKPSNFKVIWSVVSRTVNEEDIQKTIMRELNLSFYEDQDPQTRGMKINNALHNGIGNGMALLLDDIWEAIDLEELGVAGGLGLDTSMFKIIFTTRSEDVCSRMYPDQMIRINCLGPEESWTLFNRIVGEKTLYSDDRILDLANEVANECGGLPLALTVIGKAMVCKTSVGAWEDALNNLRICPSLVSGTDRNLYERLKFSYENLENQVERDCFLFCCMYPEDKFIGVDELIDGWIGDLFDVTCYDTYQETRNRGLSIVDTLVAKSMLEEVAYSLKPSVKVHDVIRDMGLWIGSKRNLFVPVDPLKMQGEEITEPENAGRWSYINDSVPESYCPHLSVLHMKCYNKGKLSLPFMHKLKVLILHYVRWECQEIPSTLELMIELRHLEISNSDLVRLPSSIGKLRKLLVIKLRYNNQLTTLPTTMGDLCELRKLHICKSPLIEIPLELENLKKLEIVIINKVNGVVFLGMFNQMTKLRRVKLIVKKLGWDVVSFNHLEELVVRVDEMEETVDDPLLMNDLIKLPSLKLLKMRRWPFSDGDDMISTLKTMRQLRELDISYSPLDKFVIPVTSHDFLSQLKSIRFQSCHQLQNIQFGERALYNLDYLQIWDCPYLKAIAGLQHLLQLRELKIGFVDECIEETLATSDAEYCLLPGLTGDCMPNLQHFFISSLKKMKRIYNDDVVFRLLTKFKLYCCPMLEKLPPGLMNTNRTLEGEIFGTVEWWEGLEWEDNDFKLYLLPLFRPDD